MIKTVEINGEKVKVRCQEILWKVQEGSMISPFPFVASGQFVACENYGVQQQEKGDGDYQVPDMCQSLC